MIPLFKRIICFVLVIGILIACLSISAFCVLDAALAGEAVAGVLDAYGMSYGIGSSYRVSSSSGVGDVFESSWNGFNEYLRNNGESTYDIMDVYHNMQHVSDAKPFVSSFTHSSGKFAGFHIDAESAEIFDKFWNWLLSGPAQMQILDNQFQWNYDQQSSIVNPVVVSLHGFPQLPIFSSTPSQSTLVSDGLYIGRSGSYRYYAGSNIANAFLCFVANGSYTYLYAFSLNNSLRIYQCHTASSNINNYGVNGSSSSVYYTQSISIYNLTRDSSVEIPIFPSLSDALSAFNGGSFTTDDLSLNPYSSDPEYDPSSDPPPPITLPVISAQDYTPVAVDIVTDIPWDDEEYGDVFPLPDSALESLVQDMADAISASDFALLDDPQSPDPDPIPPASEVFTPILPPSYPSFNFNFSGIWHYVREWVATLGSWFSLLGTVWNSLPYALVVPVYASAVIVIVLGVYKRFFM